MENNENHCLQIMCARLKIGLLNKFHSQRRSDKKSVQTLQVVGMGLVEKLTARKKVRKKLRKKRKKRKVRKKVRKKRKKVRKKRPCQWEGSEEEEEECNEEEGEGKGFVK